MAQDTALLLGWGTYMKSSSTAGVSALAAGKIGSGTQPEAAAASLEGGSYLLQRYCVFAESGVLCWQCGGFMTMVR